MKVREITTSEELRCLCRVIGRVLDCEDARIGNQNILFEARRVLTSILFDLEEQERGGSAQ